MESTLVTRTAMITGLEVLFARLMLTPRSQGREIFSIVWTISLAHDRRHGKKSKVEALIASLDAIAFSNFQ